MNLNETKREWLAFGGLVVVLLAVVLGVALLAPGVVARVLPAFFGAPVAVETPPPTPDPTPLPTATPPPTLLPTPTAAAQSATALPTLRYVVQPGDTLNGIAARHSTTVALLVEINRLDNPDRLLPGTQLLIPGPAD